MRIKIIPHIFLTPQGTVRKYYVFVTLDNGKEIQKEFDTSSEVQSFLDGLGGKK